MSCLERLALYSASFRSKLSALVQGVKFVRKLKCYFYKSTGIAPPPDDVASLDASQDDAVEGTSGGGGGSREPESAANMIDIMKTLVYVLCFCSCLEAFAGLKSFKRPLINDRFFGWFAFTVKAAETFVGFVFDG